MVDFGKCPVLPTPLPICGMSKPPASAVGKLRLNRSRDWSRTTEVRLDRLSILAALANRHFPLLSICRVCKLGAYTTKCCLLSIEAERPQVLNLTNTVVSERSPLGNLENYSSHRPLPISVPIAHPQELFRSMILLMEMQLRRRRDARSPGL